MRATREQTKIINEVIDTFKTWMENAKNENADLVAELTEKVNAVGMRDGLSDFFFDITEEAKGKIGAMAANRFEDEAVQELAIEAIEGWIAENVANRGAEDNVVCAIWGIGPEQAKQDIEAEIAKLTVAPTA